MHFGPFQLNRKRYKTFGVLIFISLCCACNNEPDHQSFTFAAPIPGDSFNVGDPIEVKLNIPEGNEAASIAYLLDGKPLTSKMNGDPLVLQTSNLPLGYRMISAVVKHDGVMDTINTNIVLKTNHAPKKLRYSVVASFPHNTNAYTEGLSFVDGKLLESTGEKGASALKYVDLRTGKDLQQVTLPAQYFGEGSVRVGNKIIMLTWQENIGFVFDAETFKQLGTFPYQSSQEGWGLSFDGKQILRTDGTNRIWKMNAETYQEEGYLEVYDDKGQVDSLNEIEFIDGKIYANVYLTSKIIRINPKNGMVEAELDLSDLVPKGYFKTSDEIQNNVLNGIAYDAKNNRIFVGGKKWPKLYEIKLLP
ncbi:MAG: glutaminyl-peptide cyclotransferase [Pedobacter sp.]|nr:glutaminyl-peptide cyclotransferase [Pedobacter sp.]MDQ8053063.1 glutaminyl-peptide cyclotransferase [Pedobacter sp.]